MLKLKQAFALLQVEWRFPCHQGVSIACTQRGPRCHPVVRCQHAFHVAASPLWSAMQLTDPLLHRCVPRKPSARWVGHFERHVWRAATREECVSVTRMHAEVRFGKRAMSAVLQPYSHRDDYCQTNAQ